jgi:hypothetical protein
MSSDDVMKIAMITGRAMVETAVVVPCSRPCVFRSSEFDEDAFVEEFSNAAAVATTGDDELSTRFAGTSKRGGPKGVLDDYKAAQADLARRVCML